MLDAKPRRQIPEDGRPARYEQGHGHDGGANVDEACDQTESGDRQGGNEQKREPIVRIGQRTSRKGCGDHDREARASEPGPATQSALARHYRADASQGEDDGEEDELARVGGNGRRRVWIPGPGGS